AFSQPPQAEQPSAFGRPAQPSQSSAFGQPSAFSQPAPNAQGPFWNQPAGGTAFNHTPPNPGPTYNPFGIKAPEVRLEDAPRTDQPPSNGMSSSQPPNPFSTGHQPIVNGFAPRQQPQRMDGAPTAPPSGYTSEDVGTYTTRGPDGKLTAFKGMRVKYVHDLPYAILSTAGGFGSQREEQLERIWFPDGAPPYEKVKDAEAPAEVYGSESRLQAFAEAYRAVREGGRFVDAVMPEEPPKVEWVGFDM
ncbi:hypothetical protein LTS18_003102, partial [Coniosporium uncinatum]